MLEGLFDPRILFILNIGLYGAAFGGYLKVRRPKIRRADPAGAFRLLETNLKKAFPDLPDGFTWREALDRLKKTDLKVDWAEVTVALRQYEGWRYGEMVQGEEVSPELTRLAKQLSRRSHSWLRI